MTCCILKKCIFIYFLDSKLWLRLVSHVRELLENSKSSVLLLIVAGGRLGLLFLLQWVLLQTSDRFIHSSRKTNLYIVGCIFHILEHLRKCRQNLLLYRSRGLWMYLLCFISSSYPLSLSFFCYCFVFLFFFCLSHVPLRFVKKIVYYKFICMRHKFLFKNRYIFYISKFIYKMEYVCIYR